MCPTKAQIKVIMVRLTLIHNYVYDLYFFSYSQCNIIMSVIIYISNTLVASSEPLILLAG